jgi:hypothetical protein
MGHGNPGPNGDFIRDYRTMAICGLSFITHQARFSGDGLPARGKQIGLGDICRQMGGVDAPEPGNVAGAGR